MNVAGKGSKHEGVKWTHLHGTPPDEIVWTNRLKTAFQAMAEKKEDYATLSRGLSEVPMEAVVQAVRVLEADVVDRSEKTLGVAKWLLELHRKLSETKSSVAKNNIKWLAVATAPPGFCHIRSTMISTLLDDVVAGLDFEVIKRRWNDKMHPLQYQRPTTISEGNLKQANDLVKKLGSEGSLDRRFAWLADVIQANENGKIWLQSDEAYKFAKPDKQGGAFDHLMPSKAKIKAVELPPKKMAWKEFSETVLSVSKEAEVLVPNHGSFYGLITSANADSPPILQWDGLEGYPRNPVSWYFYVNGSSAQNWNLIGGSWVKVSAVFEMPHQWQQPDKFKHQGAGVLFALHGAKDVNYKTGAGFFPESLRSEYHGIRAAMEAFAKNAVVTGIEDGNANGIALQKDVGVTVRVNGQIYNLTM